MNWYNYKLIKWKDGRYSVRKGWLSHSYADLSGTDTWWSNRDLVDSYAKGDVRLARQVLATFTDKGEVVE